MGVPAVGKALAVGVRGKTIVAGLEEGTQVWTETRPWACIGLLSTEVYIQDRETVKGGMKERGWGKLMSTLLGDLSRLRMSKAGHTT